MNRKYKIILGAACVALSIFLGYLKITAETDEEVFVSSDEPASATEAADLTKGTERIATEPPYAVVACDPTPDAEPLVTETPPGELVVHVCGCVNSPGVYRLEPGSRMIEAVEKAGGFTDDADNSIINLADRLSDGMQIYVPALSESVNGSGRQYVKEASNAGVTAGAGTTAGAGAGSTDATTDAGAGSSKVNINTASKDELMTLSGVGASRADAIIAYRTENGRFASIEEIMNISGIKEGLFGKIKDKITVD